jgi:hypothetical protein
MSGEVVWGRAKGFQHCIVEWIKQDSSKGQCPMCRQSEFSAPGMPRDFANRLARIRLDGSSRCDTSSESRI